MEILSLDIDVSITTNHILCTGGGIVRGEGRAECKKLCTGGIVGGRIVRGREVQTARNCVLVGLWGENCNAGGLCRLQGIVYWRDCGVEF